MSKAALMCSKETKLAARAARKQRGEARIGHPTNSLIDKLPWRDGLDAFEHHVSEGEPERWARELIRRWLPQATEDELAPALRRVALYYWAGRTMGRAGRQAKKRPANMADRSIIWLLGFVWEFYGEQCGTAARAPGRFEGIVLDAIKLIEPERPEDTLPGRQAFRTTKAKRPHVSNL